MDLKSLAVEKKVFKIQYNDKFEIEINYLPRRIMNSLYMKSQETHYVKHQEVREVNQDAYDKKLINSIFVNWTGLTLELVSKFRPDIDTSKPDYDPNIQVEFSLDNALFIYQGSVGFANWLWKKISELYGFQLDEEEEEKKI